MVSFLLLQTGLRHHGRANSPMSVWPATRLEDSGRPPSGLGSLCGRDGSRREYHWGLYLGLNDCRSHSLWPVEIGQLTSGIAGDRFCEFIQLVGRYGAFRVCVDQLRYRPT